MYEGTEIRNNGLAMELVHPEISYQVLGALFDVFNEVGYGHREVVYQKAVAASLTNRKLKFTEQVSVPLVAFGTMVGRVQLDFLVEDAVIIEIKSRTSFRAADFRQALAYLKATGKALAILAAFSPSGVRFRRILNLPGHSVLP